jgi:hypothetical protein
MLIQTQDRIIEPSRRTWERIKSLSDNRPFP